MGITGGLVKSVFSKSWSLGSHDNTARTEKRRWNSVRSYLCGDELSSGLRDEDYHGSVESFSEATTEITQFNSIVAEHNSDAAQPHSVLEEDDFGSVDLSEETVTQPNQEEEQQDLDSKGAKDERAVIIIQSAFRGFLARRLEEGTGLIVRNESPNRESSLGTSVEVQMGNSVEEERMGIQHQTNQKLRPQVIKEDWDDSTVSSNISRMRIQSRQEATTRRERALAYAFSQQLRVCSKKKEAKSNVKEASMGWSWLERWMATRLPESSLAESCCFANKSPEQIQKHPRSSIFDVLSSTGVEKESCGSNDVSVSFSGNEGDGFSVSVRRKTVLRRKTGTRGYAKVRILSKPT